MLICAYSSNSMIVFRKNFSQNVPGNTSPSISMSCSSKLFRTLLKRCGTSYTHYIKLSLTFIQGYSTVTPNSSYAPRFDETIKNLNNYKIDKVLKFIIIFEILNVPITVHQGLTYYL